VIATICVLVGLVSEPITWDQARSLPRDSPIIYDNDWLKDTNDDEYLFAKASLGQAHLKGLILTRDQWDRGRQYKLADGLNDFESALAIVRQSGFKNVPAITIGVERFLEKPKSGRVEDTKPVPSAGTDLIVREARNATPEKPLIVIVGGSLLTVASAYLTDPTIADRMVVLMTDLTGYNGPDSWANFVVASRCKLVNFGAQRVWWPQGDLPPSMPPDRFGDLPGSPVTQEMKRVADAFFERSRTKKKDRDDGFADGAGTFLLFVPASWKKVQPVQVTGDWNAVDVKPGEAYRYLDCVEIDTTAMTDEFFATMKAAIEAGTKR
jgi:hypothetical protein